MDVITLKRFSYTGEVDGEIQLLGLFTSMAYSIAAREIPLVRRKVQRVIDRTGFLPNSPDAKALRYIVEDYPRDELFQISEDDLYHFALRLLELQLQAAPRPPGAARRRGAFRVLPGLPCRASATPTEIRLKIQRILEATFAGQGETVYSSRISERPVAQLHYIVRTSPGHIPPYSVPAVEDQLAEAIRTWPDLLRATLIGSSGEETGRLTFRALRRRLFAAPTSSSCRRSTPRSTSRRSNARFASGDLSPAPLQRRRRRRRALPPAHLRAGQPPLAFSDILPMLENMGLQVISENPFEALPAGAGQKVWVRDFEAVAQDGALLDEDADNDRFQDAFRRVYRGEIESDGFNKLVLKGNLGWRQVVVLRAYSKCLRQAGAAFSQAYMEQTLARYGQVANAADRPLRGALRPRPPGRCGPGGGDHRRTSSSSSKGSRASTRTASCAAS